MSFLNPPGDRRNSDTNPEERAAMKMADMTFAALTRGRRPEDAGPQPGSTLRFQDGDIFELAIAGTKLADYMVSTDRLSCLVCMSKDGNMLEARNHQMLCQVRRWLEAVDRLKVGIEVR